MANNSCRLQALVSQLMEDNGMWDFSVRRALGMMVKTWPFIAFRLAIYFGIAPAYILAMGTGATLGWGVGAWGDADIRTSWMIWGGVFGFGLASVVLYFLREYVLYIVKAGHIAVLVALMDNDPVPDGLSQINYATGEVKNRFAEANVLFAVDQLVRGVLRAITGLTAGVAFILPIPYLQQLIAIVRAFLNIALGLVDEVILAYAIRTQSTNPWASARTALVLYGQNYEVMLKNAAWLTLFSYLISAVVFLVMLAPAAALVWLLPGDLSSVSFVLALIAAWGVKAALIEPFAIACLMEVYFKVIEGQTPDSTWELRLSKASHKFGQLRDKAAAWVGQGNATRITPT